MLSANCTAALDIVNQWMETNYPPSISPFNRPVLKDPDANALVCSAHWPLTSPPLHNNSSKLHSLADELGKMQRRRKNPLCSSDRSIVKNVVYRLSNQQAIDKHHRLQNKVELHIKRKFSSIVTCEEAEKNHKDCYARLTRLQVETAEAQLDADAAMAYLVKLRQKSDKK